MPDLNDISSLDKLAGSRSSVASVSSDSGILDEFPIPDSILQSVSKSPKPEAHGNDTRAHVESPEPHQWDRSEKSQINLHPHTQNRLFNKPLTTANFNERAKRWNQTYGHHYKNSLQNEPWHIIDNKELTRPRLARTHSVSRSWDAGLRFQFPSPIGFSPLSSWENHVRAGMLAVINKDYLPAKFHWDAAAAYPWDSEYARLLIQIGIHEKWFPDQPGLTPQLSVIDPQLLVSLTAPHTGLIADALTNYAAWMRSIQHDIDSLKCYELAGELGSKDAIITAAQIYFKGSRHVRRDVAKAQRFFKRAQAI